MVDFHVKEKLNKKNNAIIASKERAKKIRCLPHETISNESIVLGDFIDNGAQTRQTTVDYGLIVTAR